jgi:tRNA(Ile)-lysidine synthase
VHKFVLNLITEWRKLALPFAEDTVVVAVSGGADSLALLLGIDDLRTRKKLALRIVAAHFNHKLRGRESDADEEFVKQTAAERGFELAVGHGTIEKSGNLEQNARNARYEFLHSTAQNLKAGWVLTAHTMNDQAETFLLNLIRGSGIDGLSGMRPVRELREREKGRKGDGETERSISPSPLLPFSLSPPLLVRPLLRWARREDTENFCRESGVEFRYDTMNEDMSFKRVRVRKMLLPMLKEFNPKIIETLALTAELMQKSVPPASAGGTDAVERSTPIPEELTIKDLQTLDPGTLHETIRSWLKHRRASLRSVGLKHIEAIEQLIHSKKSGRTVELPGSGLVRKQNGRLRFENIKVD